MKKISVKFSPIFTPLLMTAILLTSILSLVNCRQNKGKAKQIILISIDTLRADRMDLYGYYRETAPNLTKLAQDSLYFERAYSNASWTIPSHISLLTGTYPSRHGINKSWKTIRKNNQYPQLNRGFKSIAQLLRSQGLKTIKFAGLPNELGFGRGFDINEQTDPFKKEIFFKEMTDKLVEYKEDDFFYFIHTWRVHAPYSDSRYLQADQVKKETRERIDNFRQIRENEKSTNVSAEFVEYLKELDIYNAKHCSDLYDGGIQYVDNFIGRLIARLKELGIYDNAMIIVVSDHGEHFDEHLENKFYGCHGLDFYEEFIRVPLILKYPGNERRGKVDRPVSLKDVPATILDYYGYKTPNYMQGRSLLEENKNKAPGFIFSEAISHDSLEKKMLLVGDLKYIITMGNPQKPERVNWDKVMERKLFDLNADPLEKTDLYEDKKYRKVCLEFEKMIKKIVRSSANFKKSGDNVKINQETINDLESLGYL